ncbi:MAG: hypothetical protein Q8N18_18135 [Opitutaceae bacterium]|nr:hypothetical protein [Opitutaceae bacterium]
MSEGPYKRLTADEIAEHMAAGTWRKRATAYDEIRSLEEAALKGDPRAVPRLRMIRDYCDVVLFSLPVKPRRKKPSLSTPTNELANLLLEKLRAIQAGRTADFVDAELAERLRAQLPKTLVLDFGNFSQWQKAALFLMKSDKSKRVQELIDQICINWSQKPIPGAQLASLKKVLRHAASNHAKSGASLGSYPEVKSLVRACEAKKLSYAWRLVKKAAKRIRVK